MYSCHCSVSWKSTRVRDFRGREERPFFPFCSELMFALMLLIFIAYFGVEASPLKMNLKFHCLLAEDKQFEFVTNHQLIFQGASFKTSIFRRCSQVGNFLYIKDTDFTITVVVLFY